MNFSLVPKLPLRGVRCHLIDGAHAWSVVARREDSRAQSEGRCKLMRGGRLKIRNEKGNTFRLRRDIYDPNGREYDLALVPPPSARPFSPSLFKRQIQPPSVGNDDYGG